jgi:TusA-related sulfurtransferase
MPDMNHSIDMIGHLCPAPLDALIVANDKATTGDTITINFDCAQATENLPNWAAANGHQVLSLTKTGNAKWSIVIQKGR